MTSSNVVRSYKTPDSAEDDQWTKDNGHNHCQNEPSQDALVKSLYFSSDFLLNIVDVAILGRVLVKVILEELEVLKGI